MALLAGADLTYVDVRRTDLRGASLCGANMTGVDLRTATLDGADMTGVTGVAIPLMALAERYGVRIGDTPFGA